MIKDRVYAFKHQAVNAQRGSALTWIMMISMVLLILLVAVQVSASRYFNSSISGYEDQQAYITARSVVNAIADNLLSSSRNPELFDLISDMKNVRYEIDPKSIHIDPLEGVNMGDIQEIKIEKDEIDKLTISATASVNGGTRKVSLDMRAIGTNLNTGDGKLDGAYVKNYSDKTNVTIFGINTLMAGSNFNFVTIPPPPSSQRKYIQDKTEFNSVFESAINSGIIDSNFYDNTLNNTTGLNIRQGNLGIMGKMEIYQLNNVYNYSGVVKKLVLTGSDNTIITNLKIGSSNDSDNGIRSAGNFTLGSHTKGQISVKGDIVSYYGDIEINSVSDINDLTLSEQKIVCNNLTISYNGGIINGNFDVLCTGTFLINSSAGRDFSNMNIVCDKLILNSTSGSLVLNNSNITCNYIEFNSNESNGSSEVVLRNSTLNIKSKSITLDGVEKTGLSSNTEVLNGKSKIANSVNIGASEPVLTSIRDLYDDVIVTIPGKPEWADLTTNSTIDLSLVAGDTAQLLNGGLYYDTSRYDTLSLSTLLTSTKLRQIDDSTNNLKAVNKDNPLFFVVSEPLTIVGEISDMGFSSPICYFILTDNAQLTMELSSPNPSVTGTNNMVIYGPDSNVLCDDRITIKGTYYVNDFQPMRKVGSNFLNFGTINYEYTEISPYNNVQELVSIECWEKVRYYTK